MAACCFGRSRRLRVSTFPQLVHEPALWGITLDQIRRVREHPSFRASTSVREGNAPVGSTVRDVVRDIIIPATEGKGMGYALMCNVSAPLRAAVAVSHAWDEQFDSFLDALQSTGEPGPFWVAAFAIYQPDDLVELSIASQTGTSLYESPFAQVVRQAKMMIIVVGPDPNVYSRCWCLLEITMAMDAECHVRLSSFVMPLGPNDVSTPFFDVLEEPVSAQDSRCSTQLDELKVRAAINARPGGLAAVNRAIERARLETLLETDFVEMYNNSAAHFGFEPSAKHSLILRKRVVDLAGQVRARLSPLGGEAVAAISTARAATDWRANWALNPVN